MTSIGAQERSEPLFLPAGVLCSSHGLLVLRAVAMSARQLNRLAKAKGLDPLLGGNLNVDSDESDVLEDSEEEGNFATGAVVSASVSCPVAFVCGVGAASSGSCRIKTAAIIKKTSVSNGRSWHLNACL